MSKFKHFSNKYFNINTGSIHTSSVPRRRKSSEGIILFRRTTDCQYQLLIIKSPISYAFIELIYGRYTRYVDMQPDHVFETLCRLTNNITPEEKRLFCTFDFDSLFFYITNRKYNNIVFTDRLTDNEYKQYLGYTYANKIFYDNIYVNKEKLLTYINSSYNKHINLWQIPKGKRNPRESQLDCAIREFEEETSIKSADYDILYNVKPLRFSTVIADTQYDYNYFVATLKNNVSPRLKYNFNKGYIEVTDIRWVNINKLELFISNQDFLKSIKKISRYVKKLFKMSLSP